MSFFIIVIYNKLKVNTYSLGGQNVLNVSNHADFKVAMYIRLSKEDGDKQESESVTNQRNLILRYIKDNNLELFDEYIDDGVSRNYF